MTAFYPVISQNGFLIEDTKKTEPEFYKNLKIVLKHYGVEYKSQDGILYVKKKTYKEKELMMNYTIKARDENWLSQIRKEQ